MSAQTRLNEALPESQQRLSHQATTLATHGYIVGDVIGQGTYAVVKKAYWTKFKRTVAIKIMSKTNAGETFLQKCLPRELDAIRNLRHENIIHYYEVIETTMRVYISMRYAEHGTLLSLIRKQGHLPEVRARRYYRQLLAALEYIHTAGYAHRDIKLENMVLDGNDRLKLIDFGFACRARDAVAPVLSKTFCGSHAYASPELLRFKPYDPVHADIWASGVVLYSLLYGKLPFSNEKQVNLLLQKINRGVIFPSSITVTREVQCLLKQLFLPVEKRITWPELGRSLWFFIELEDESPGQAEWPQPAPDGVAEPSAAKRSKLDNKA
uniref:testis-specific serine/threonine-protein kinase 3-like isoform X1 n=1 Tax=Anopheles coluzzii TaxID=1518534 RepID=UPI0020FFC161|nr:testis-specific serine/threonine-protein kinase 3-like isoform X1 [Anopheles coluzzii]